MPPWPGRRTLYTEPWPPLESFSAKALSCTAHGFAMHSLPARRQACRLATQNLKRQSSYSPASCKLNVKSIVKCRNATIVSLSGVEKCHGCLRRRTACAGIAEAAGRNRFRGASRPLLTALHKRNRSAKMFNKRIGTPAFFEGIASPWLPDLC